MSNQCQHILPSGERCRAHPMHGVALCYFHSNLNRVEHARVTCKPLPFAPIEDLRGIQLALTQVFNLLDDPYAETDHVCFYLRALKLATQLAIRSEAAQHSVCPRCGRAVGQAPEPPSVELTGMHDFLPNRIRLYPDSKLIESSTLSVNQPEPTGP